MELGYIDGIMTVIVLELIGYFIYWRLKVRKQEREFRDSVIPPSGGFARDPKQDRKDIP